MAILELRTNEPILSSPFVIYFLHCDIKCNIKIQLFAAILGMVYIISLMYVTRYHYQLHTVPFILGL